MLSQGQYEAKLCANHTVFAQMTTTEKGDGAVTTGKGQTAQMAFRIMLPTADDRGLLSRGTFPALSYSTK